MRAIMRKSGNVLYMSRNSSAFFVNHSEHLGLVFVRPLVILLVVEWKLEGSESLVLVRWDVKATIKEVLILLYCKEWERNIDLIPANYVPWASYTNVKTRGLDFIRHQSEMHLLVVTNLDALVELNMDRLLSTIRSGGNNNERLELNAINVNVWYWKQKYNCYNIITQIDSYSDFDFTNSIISSFRFFAAKPVRHPN